MLNQAARNTVKHALALSRVKLMYTRITLTKFTTTYFFGALIYCGILVSLQAMAAADNTQARNVISNVVGSANMKGLVVNVGGELEWCRELPEVDSTKCNVIKATFVSNATDTTAETATEPKQMGIVRGKTGFQVVNILQRDVHAYSGDLFSTGYEVQPLRDSEGALTGVRVKDQILTKPCVRSLLWLQDALRDSIVEDITVLVFHIWLFALSFVTILNESLPHLFTVFAGHAVVTAWAGYRVGNGKDMQRMYDTLILEGTCAEATGPGKDILGSWWEERRTHEIPTIVLSAASFLLIGLLSIKLYKVYAQQSFARVGASQSNSQVHVLYRLVLALSSLLQLAGFFVLASGIMWIDKASTGAISSLAQHLAIYKALLIALVVLVIPWLVTGWRSVRKEQRKLFWVFLSISVLFLGASSACFGSHLYRFIFSTWPLFASMTIFAYVLIVAITVVGIVCRIYFGKGLKEFLIQTETPEGADFAPVYIANFPNSPEDDEEKGKMDFYDLTYRSGDFVLPTLPVKAHHDVSPTPTYAAATENRNFYNAPAYQESFFDYNSPIGESRRNSPVTNRANGYSPVTRTTSPQAGRTMSPMEAAVARSPSGKAVRVSVFNDPTRATVKMSSTPPVAQGSLSDVPKLSEPEPPRLNKAKLHRKGSSKKLVIGLPSNPRKGGVPISRAQPHGDYF